MVNDILKPIIANLFQFRAYDPLQVDDLVE
jgi:hypothetical protein